MLSYSYVVSILKIRCKLKILSEYKYFLVSSKRFCIIVFQFKIVRNLKKNFYYNKNIPSTVSAFAKKKLALLFCE